MKVFVSSVVSGYRKFRSAARDAIEALEYEPVLMERTRPASPSSPRVACLSQVAESDIVVLLIGCKYGGVLESGKSATHEEWDHARLHNKTVLVFVEDLDSREDHQVAFLDEVGDWSHGRFWNSFSKPIDLLPKIVRALNRVGPTLPEDEHRDPVEKLPPSCLEPIETIQRASPSAAKQLILLLSDPALRNTGFAPRLIKDPPVWLSEMGAVGWDVISRFLYAYGLEGAHKTRQLAIDTGSTRKDLYRVGQALEAAERGNKQRADCLLDQVTDGYPLQAVARSYVIEDMASVVKAVTTEGLHLLDDNDLAMYSAVMLAVAYVHMEDFDLATKVLRDTNARFPNRAGLLLQQAEATMYLANQIGFWSTGSQDLFSEVADLALRSRDCSRRWEGPSHRAVAIATEAFLALDEPQRVIDLASRPPHGEATAKEASNPRVQINLAQAYLMLGRLDDIDTLRLEGVDASEAAHIRALQADQLGDAAALSRMRRSLSQAADEPSRLRAMFGLAMLGEVSNADLDEVPEADAALFRGVAAFMTAHSSEAVRILFPHRFKSPLHTHYLAKAQHRIGETDSAIETLTDAADHLDCLFLLEPAAEMSLEQGYYDEAEVIVTRVLAREPSRALLKRMKKLLVDIAHSRQDWRTMESYAQSLAREFPDDKQIPWLVVYSLHRQGRNRHAWGYLAGHNLIPFSEDTAQLAVAVCGAVEIPEGDTERLLEIARMYPESEQVAGSVIVRLLAQGDCRGLSDEQLSQLHELTEDFIARYPQSEVLRAYSAERPEELLEMMVAPLRSRPEQHDELINQVRYGRLPYGTLLFLRPDLPYTEVLLSVAADWLTAIPTDPQQRARERNTAMAALGGEVAVDTSVVALGIGSGLDVNQFGTVFKSVRVADELLIDARWAVSVAKAPVSAILGYDPVMDRPIMSEINESQRRERLEKAESALEILTGWQSVKSGPLRLWSNDEDDSFRPWDASLRVAHSVDNCSLWCDDLALRSLAESQGIPAFGTWALYEALSEPLRPPWLLPAEHVKMRLLRAGIADVPITLTQLTQAIDDSDGPDIAVASLLSRPRVWYDHLAEVVTWFGERVRELMRGNHGQWIPVLVNASCRGISTLAAPHHRAKLMGSILALALIQVNDLTIVPDMVAASRYAATAFDTNSEVDPLPEAVRTLVGNVETTIGPKHAARFLTLLFSEADPSDRLTVTSILLEDR